MLPFDQSWGRTFFFIIMIMDLKKLNWNLDEYITYKQVSIYFVLAQVGTLYTHNSVYFFDIIELLAFQPGKIILFFFQPAP